MKAIIHDGSSYWAVGKFGLIMTSPNGQDWIIEASGETEHYVDLVYTPWGYTILGEGGAIRTSSDGETWTEPAHFCEIDPMRAMTYWGGLFVAVGPSNKLCTSVNQVDWTDRNTGTTRRLYDVVHDGFQYIAVGEDATICKSIGGYAWTATECINGLDVTFKDIQFLNGTYVIVGNSGTILTSIDAINWTDASLPDPDILSGSFYWDDQYFVFGEELYASPTASGFTNTHSFPHVMKATANDGQLVVVAGEAGEIHTSANGTAWTRESSGPSSKPLYGIAYGNGRYIAGNSSVGKVLTSTDGVNWSEISIGLAMTIRDVDFIGDTFLAVGYLGKIATSTDGLAWTVQASPTSAHLIRIGSDGSTTIVVGFDGVILYSHDLVLWNVSDTGTTTDSLWAIACGNDGGTTRFVAGGMNGVILHSPDGQVWTPASNSGTSKNIYSMFADGERFWAVGSEGLIMHSLYGDDWCPVIGGLNTSFEHVMFDGVKLRVFGNSQTMLVSDDGILFASELIPVWNTIMSSVHVDGKLFFVGTRGTLAELQRLFLSFEDWPQSMNVTDFVLLVNDSCP